jgi:pyruvate ferredoxin oxidoreductase beta subunit
MSPWLGLRPGRSEEIAEQAVETGVWPLKESALGALRHTYIPERLRPVADYLEPQRRFRHLFRPRRQDDAIATIQSRVDAYWQRVRAAELASDRRKS